MKYQVKLRIVVPRDSKPDKVEKFAFSLAEGKSINIGRETKRLTIRDASVSKIHCKLAIEKGKLFVTNESERIGTSLNERKVERARVRPGDMLKLGNAVIEVLEAPVPADDLEPDTVFIDTSEDGESEPTGKLPSKAAARAVPDAPEKHSADETREIDSGLEETAEFEKPSRTRTKKTNTAVVMEATPLKPRVMGKFGRFRLSSLSLGTVKVKNPFSGIKSKNTLLLLIAGTAVFFGYRNDWISGFRGQIQKVASSYIASQSENTTGQANPPAATTQAVAPPSPMKTFFVSAQQGSIDGVRRYLEVSDTSGDGANATSPNGTTALMLAAYGGHLDIVRYLISKGAEINQSDRSGTTALMWAAQGSQNQVMALLIKSGARASVRNLNGERAVDMVKRLGNSSGLGLFYDESTEQAAADSSADAEPEVQPKKKSSKKQKTRTIHQAKAPARATSRVPTSQPVPKAAAKPASKRHAKPAAQRDSAAEFSDKFFGE